MTSTDGAPLRSAQVCVVLGEGEGAERAQAGCVLSDREGRYALAGQPPGPLRACATAADHLPACTRRTADEPVDFKLAPGGARLSGEVDDLRGEPVVAAWISVRSSAATGLAISTFSDARGHFVATVPRGEVALRVEAPSYATARLEASAPDELLRIVLWNEASLFGRVIRQDTGAPLADAEVTVAGEPSTASGAIGPLRTHADDAGRFVVAGLEAGSYRVQAQAQGWYGELADPVRLAPGQSSQEQVITARPAVTVRGRVVSGGEHPSCEGEVTLTRTGERTPLLKRSVHEGAVEIVGVPKGEYAVGLRCDGFLSPTTPPPLSVKDADLDVEWTLEREAYHLRGVVVTEAGQPVGATLVGIEPVPSRGGTLSDGDGHFELGGLSPGTYRLVAYAPTGKELGPPVEVTVGPSEEPPPVRLVARALGAVHGRVRTSSGRPIASAEVLVDGPGGQEGTSTSVSGKFAIGSLAPGRYRIWTAGAGTQPPPAAREIDVTAGNDSEIELSTDAFEGWIAGEVRTASGSPAPDVLVFALTEDDEPQDSAGTPRHGTFSGPGGRFRIEGLAPGRYRLVASRKDGADAQLDGVSTFTEQRLTLTAAGALHGEVVGAHGPPTAFTLRLEAEGGVVRRVAQFGAGDGRWRLEAVRPGSYVVSATSASGFGRANVELHQGDDASLRLELTPYAHVHGRVVDTSQRPLARAVVQIAPVGGAWSEWGSAVTDAGGVFEIATAPPGDFVVQAVLPEAGLVARGTGHATPAESTEVGELVARVGQVSGEASGRAGQSSAASPH